MAEKPDFDKIFANKATSVHEWDKDDYDTGWGFLGETPPPYELFDSLQRENDTKTKYLYERAEEINTDLTQDINNLQSDLNSKYSELKTGLGSTNTALQQHNVDENAHANLFKRALVTEAKTAANTVDWNTLTESRTYKISGATFAADKHQPVGAVGTGELVVLKNGDDTIAQVYYANSAAYDKAGAYHRMCIGGTWTNWVYNITNVGGSLTGDLNINGKLTVNEVQVTDRLLIGDVDPANPDTSNFLTKDDLQKLQDQIIAPEQNIYVSNNGSDETGDGTRSKPYKTIDKAGENIKEDVPKINIRIIDDTGTIPFYISKCIRSKTGNTHLTIMGDSQEYNINQKKRIQIYVNPSSYFDYTYQKKTWNVYGYFIAFDWENITITALEIHPPTGITAPSSPYQPNIEKYNRQLFQSYNLTIKYSLITLNNNCLWCPRTSNCFLSNVLSTVNQQSDFYIINAYFNRFTEEDETVRPVSGTFGSITSIINSENGNFTGNTSKLLTDNCHCIYKNF